MEYESATTSHVLNSDIAKISGTGARQSAGSGIDGTKLFYAMIGLLVLNAAGFMVALVILPPDHTAYVVMLMLVLFLSLAPMAIIGWTFYRMLTSAREITRAAQGLAGGQVAEIGAMVKAIGEGDFARAPRLGAPAALAPVFQGEIADLAANFNRLQEETGGVISKVEQARQALHQSYSGLWAENEQLRVAVAEHVKHEEELSKARSQFEAQAGHESDKLHQASEKLEREFAEHKRTEDALQRLEMVFKNAGWGAATINTANGILLSVNPAFAEMHGYHQQELVGKPLDTLVMQEGFGDVSAHIARAVQKKNYSYETVHVRRDGSPFPVLVSTVTVANANGQQHLATNVQDITALKKTEVLLKQAREETENAKLSRNQFLARMSHELRTPLNVILGFGQLLEMNLPDSEHHESAEHILKAGKHLLSLINEVLDISRIETDKLSLSLQVVPVGEVMLSAMSMVRPSAMQRGIQFVDQLNSRGEKFVVADNQRLQQVFLNLVSNAVKYNKPGGRVTVWCSERSDNRLAVSVTDTGSGIPAEKLTQLFTPFERLGADLHGIEGTGLGLALSKRLMALMDGDLEVSSIPGEGSTFSVVIPVASSPVQKLGKLADERLTSKERSALSATAKLLYIEPDVSNIRLVEKLLKPYRKIGLVCAQSGQEGIDTARQQKPDMILLDLDLEDMPGEKVLETLRKQPETDEIRVVVISADTTPRRIEQMLKQGASQYLIKPIDISKLLVAIGESIKIRENLTA